MDTKRENIVRSAARGWVGYFLAGLAVGLAFMFLETIFTGGSVLDGLAVVGGVLKFWPLFLLIAAVCRLLVLPGLACILFDVANEFINLLSIIVLTVKHKTVIFFSRSILVPLSPPRPAVLA